MGHEKSGRRPDEKRRRQVLELREQGLTLAEIGRRLGVRTQAVSGMLARIAAAGQEPRYPVRCRACDRLIWADGRGPQNGAVSCLECLAGQPEVSFGERLKAHRLAAKLTQELADRTGLRQTALRGYECDDKEPGWRNLARLLAVLGVRLLQIPPVQAPAPRKQRR
jgi:transcriptional regulator with XRE-family HTH domain